MAVGQIICVGYLVYGQVQFEIPVPENPARCAEYPDVVENRGIVHRSGAPDLCFQIMRPGGVFFDENY